MAEDPGVFVFTKTLGNKSDPERDRKLEEQYCSVVKERNHLKEQLLLVQEHDFDVVLVTEGEDLTRQIKQLKEENMLLHEQVKTNKEDFDAERRDRTNAHAKLNDAIEENNKLQSLLEGKQKDNVSQADMKNLHQQCAKKEKKLKLRITELEHDSAELKDLRIYQKERELELNELKEKLEKATQIPRVSWPAASGDLWHVEGHLSQLPVATGSKPPGAGDYSGTMGSYQTHDNYRRWGAGSLPRSFSSGYGNARSSQDNIRVLSHSFSEIGQQPKHDVRPSLHQSPFPPYAQEHIANQVVFAQLPKNAILDQSLEHSRAFIPTKPTNPPPIHPGVTDSPELKQRPLFEDELVHHAHPGVRHNPRLRSSVDSLEFSPPPHMAPNRNQHQRPDRLSTEVLANIQQIEPYIPEDWASQQHKGASNEPLADVNVHDIMVKQCPRESPVILQSSLLDSSGEAPAKSPVVPARRRKPPVPVAPPRRNIPSVPRKLPQPPPHIRYIPPNSAHSINTSSPSPKPRQRLFPKHNEVQSHPQPRQRKNNVLLDGLDDDIMIENKLMVEQQQKPQTDEQIPVDPNLTCPVCRRQFRTNQTQNCRAHVKICLEERGQRQNTWAASSAGNTETFSFSMSPE